MSIGIVVAVDAEHEARIVSALAAHPSRVTIARRPADDAELLAGAHAGLGSVVILSRYFSGFVADLVRQLARWGMRVLGLSDDAAAMQRVGIASSVPVQASAEEILAAIEALPEDPAVPPLPPGSPQVGAAGTLGSGRVLTVWGTAGAPGRSTVALAVADELAAGGSATLVLDADTVASSTAPMLGLVDDTPALTALCHAAARGDLDARLFESHVRYLESGLGVVPGLNRADRWPEIRPAALEGVVDKARELADVVIVDCSHLREEEDGMDFSLGRHSATSTALDVADAVLLVGSGDPVGLQRLVLMLGEEFVRALEPSIVVNRLRASAVGGEPRRQVLSVLERFTGREPLALISEDRPAFDQAVLVGKTLREVGARSPARSALAGLSEAVSERLAHSDTLTV